MMRTILTGLVLALATATSAQAQSFGIAYTGSSIDHDPEAGTVEASCYVLLDYTAEAYYQTATNCYIYYGSNIPAHIVDNDWGYGNNYASVELGYPYAAADTTYSVQGTFYVVMPYFYEDWGYYYYYDPYEYRYYGGAGVYEPWYYEFYGYNAPQYVVSYDTLFLGYVYDSVATGPGPADHVKVITDNHGYPVSCPSTGIAVRQMHMQIVDSSGTAIDHNASIAETYSSQPTNTCTGQQIPGPSSCAASGDGGTGQFIDTLRVSSDHCGSGIPQSSTCGFSLTATWSACGGGRSNQLWQSSRITQANSVTVDSNNTNFSSGTTFH